MANLNISHAQRLDQKVVELLPQISRTFAVRLIEEGKVTVNGVPISKPGFKLRDDDTVIADYDVRQLEQIPDINLPVLYEDADCVIVDKPVGVLSHSKGAFNPEATVATWLRNRLRSELRGERAGIVHRLDRSTSGVMICAKTVSAQAWLQKQFSQRKVKKVYIAVIPGTLPHEHAVIDMPIERNPHKPQTFRTGASGKPAFTEYVILKTNGKYTVVELRPKTGRTHQLRVHMQKVNHPIIGDKIYGGEPADRLFLHAQTLELTLPNHKRMIFTSKLPSEFYRWVNE